MYVCVPASELRFKPESDMEGEGEGETPRLVGLADPALSGGDPDPVDDALEVLEASESVRRTGLPVIGLTLSRSVVGFGAPDVVARRQEVAASPLLGVEAAVELELEVDKELTLELEDERELVTEDEPPPRDVPPLITVVPEKESSSPPLPPVPVRIPNLPPSAAVMGTC